MVILLYRSGSTGATRRVPGAAGPRGEEAKHYTQPIPALFQTEDEP